MKKLHFQIFTVFALNFLFAFGAGALFGQTPLTEPQPSGRVTFEEVLLALKSGPHIGQTIDDVNNILLAEVRKRCVKFVLDKPSKKIIKDAFASGELISAINACLTGEQKEILRDVLLMPGQKDRLIELKYPGPEWKRLQELNRLANRVRETFKDKSLEGRRLFVMVGKEFLEKYSHEEDEKALVEWLKVNLPRSERIISEMQEVRSQS